MAHLFDTYKLGPYELSNRIVMAPMTRCRADFNTRVPTPMMVTYYQQRASAGLIISEATVVTSKGVGYPATPGIYNDDQVKAWQPITKAVHDGGGRIFLQLWHCGRVSHSSMLGGQLPVSASAIPIKGEVYTASGMVPYETPRALTLSEIKTIPSLFADGAKRAMDAGFDGVEIHGANGYLLDQFLRDGTNKRTDDYGGSINNRTRLLIETTEAVINVWGRERVGVRLSPGGTFNGMSDSKPEDHFVYVAHQLARLGISYLHINETNDADVRHGGKMIDSAIFRQAFKGTFIACGSYTQERACDLLAKQGADLIAFGIPFIANPDLPQRLRNNKPLAASDQNTFYVGGEKGYIDYPFLSV